MQKQKMNFLDVKHPYFRPLWVRLLITGLTLAWAFLELFMGHTIWFALFFLCGAYLVREFFLRFDPADYEKSPDASDDA